MLVSTATTEPCNNMKLKIQSGAASQSPRGRDVVSLERKSLSARRVPTSRRTERERERE